MIRKLFRRIFGGENESIVQKAKITRDLCDIYDTLSNIYFHKNGVANSVLTVSYSDGFMASELIVKIDDVSVFGILMSSAGYDWSKYTHDQELIQQTLEEIYLIMDNKTHADMIKAQEDAVRAKNALEHHKKYVRTWLHE